MSFQRHLRVRIRSIRFLFRQITSFGGPAFIKDFPSLALLHPIPQAIGQPTATAWSALAGTSHPIPEQALNFTPSSATPRAIWTAISHSLAA